VVKKQINEVDSKFSLKCKSENDDDEIDFDYPLHPVVHNFKEAIEKNPKITMFFHQMFAQFQLSTRRRQTISQVTSTNQSH